MPAKKNIEKESQLEDQLREKLEHELNERGFNFRGYTLTKKVSSSNNGELFIDEYQIYLIRSDVDDVFMKKVFSLRQKKKHSSHPIHIISEKTVIINPKLLTNGYYLGERYEHIVKPPKYVLDAIYEMPDQIREIRNMISKESE